MKSGSTGECYIELDLLNSDRVECIRRGINSDKRPWMVNGKIATQKEAKELVKSLKIDVDNLCSFMSQDKVGQFTNQSPQGILQKTLQCVYPNGGELSLRDEQLALSSAQTDSMDRERLMLAKKTAYDDLRVLLGSMQIEYDRFMQRKDTKEKLELYKIRLLTEEVKEMAQLVRNKQTEFEDAERRYEEGRALLDPIKDAQAGIKRQLVTYDKVLDTSKSKCQSVETNVTKCKEAVFELETELEATCNELDSIENDRKALERKLADEIEKEQLKTKELQTAKSAVSNLEEENTKNMSKLKTLEPQKLLYEEKLSDMETRKKDLLSEKNRLDLRLKNYQDPMEKVKSKLDSYGAAGDACKRAWTFIEREQDNWIRNGNLKERIIGPIFSCMKIANDDVAIMLEKCIKLSKLLSFIVTSDADRQFLQQQLHINSLKSDITCLKEIDDRPNGNPQIITNFKSIGVQGYLTDQVETTAIVRSYLHEQWYIDRVLWSRTSQATREMKTTDIQNICNLSRGTVTLYELNDSVEERTITEHRGSISAYDKSSVGINSSIVSEKNKVILKQSGIANNNQQRDELLVKSREIDSNLKALEDEIRKCKEKGASLLDEINGLKKERDKVKKLLLMPKELEQKVSTIRENIRRYEANMSKTVDSSRNSLQSDYKKSTSRFFKAIDDFKISAESLVQFRVDYCVAESLRKYFNSKKIEIDEKLADLEDGLQNLMLLKENSKTDLESARKEKERIDEKVNALRNDKNFKELLKRAMAMTDCTETTIADLKSKIKALEDNLKSSIDNEDIVTRYRSTEEAMNRTKIELDVISKDFENVQAGLQTRLINWLNQVEHLTDRLNNSFKEYMSKLQYEGEVVLRKPNLIDDYEIHMRVLFREGSTLADLSGLRHSGGERAVSTIMYLMALQAFTKSPFRVVDEINQGMDERNERLVFDRIVQSCCGSSSQDLPQYFLVSPKLLQGLRAMEHDDVTVLLVMNGPGLKRKWNMDNLVHKALTKRTKATL